MSVADLQAASATTFNEAFLSRKIGTWNTIGTIDLENVLAASGTSIFNVQKNVNALANALGIPVNQLISFVPVWTNNGIGSASDSTRQKIDEIVTYVLNLNSLISGLSFWQKINVLYSDLADPSMSFTDTIGSLGAKEVLEGLVIAHTESFLGGSITEYTIDVGVTGEEDKFITDFDVFQTPTGQTFEYIDTKYIGDMLVGTSLVIRAESVGDDLDQATQGSLDIWLRKSTLP